jgi:hypothetical protein
VEEDINEDHIDESEEEVRRKKVSEMMRMSAT